MILRQPQVLWILIVLLPLFLFWTARRRWPWPAMVARLVLTTLIVLALADPVLNPPTPPERLVFLLDQSLSLGTEGRLRVRQWVDQARQQGYASAPIVTFSGRPTTEADFKPGLDPVALDSRLNLTAQATDLAAAIDFGRQLLGAGGGRLVLLSDGAQTRGDALAAASRVADAGLTLDTVSVAPPSMADARLASLNVPATLRVGEQYEVGILVEATTAGRGTLTLTRDGATLATQQVDLAAGRNTFTFPARAEREGFIQFRADINADDDSVPLNNALENLARVYPRPRILVIEAQAGASSELRAALTSAGVDTEVRTPANLPARLSVLSVYDAVVLLDVAANPSATEQMASRSLSTEQMLLLQEYVRQMGHGLLVIGGRNSYELGQYKGTALEATLPVNMQPQPRKERPPVALLLIIDHSGSMGTGPGSLLSMAKEAAILAADKLERGDRLGVLIFDTETVWSVPFTPVGEGLEKQRIQDQIAKIPGGGGTEILGALKVGLPELAQQPVNTKHAVLLTDGRSFTGRPPDYQETVEEARRANITLSTVAIGDGADIDLLTQLAQWGQGRYHFAAKPTDIPRISVEESAIARADPVQEGVYRAELAAPHAILRGLAPRDLPPLQGFISVTPKPEAEVVLRAPEGDPILSVWQYGLGRVVAWTSDQGTNWAKDWPAWSEYGRFWAQLVRYTLADPATGPVHVDLIPSDRPSEATLQVDVLDETGVPIDLADVGVRVTPPEGEARQLALRQVAPGRYEQTVSLPVEGAYRFEVAVQKAGLAPLTREVGFVQPYAAEFIPRSDGASVMTSLAQRGGGRVLTQPSEMLPPSAVKAPPTQVLWPWLLAAALLLWPLEIAIRRLWPKERVERLTGERG